MQAVNGSVRHLVWMISTEVSHLPFVLASSGSISLLPCVAIHVLVNSIGWIEISQGTDGEVSFMKQS